MQRHRFVVSGVELDVVEGQPTIRGECDHSNADKIESWLSSFGKAAIDVDLSGVTFFDAAALRAILAAWRRNPNMRIVEPSPIVQRVLRITATYGCLVDSQWAHATE
jgi:anti-anti-sigma factor